MGRYQVGPVPTNEEAIEVLEAGAATIARVPHAIASLMAGEIVRAVREREWDAVADKIEDEYTTLRGLADYLRRENPHRRDIEELEKKIGEVNERHGDA